MSASIIVEDGSIISGANSYVSTTELTTFASNRGITITGTLADLLIQAMDYIENLPFKGVKLTEDQPLQWPRGFVNVDGYYIRTDEIPQQLKDGLCHCAIAIDQGNDPIQDLSQTAIRKKVGDLEIEYAQGTTSVTVNRKILNVLKKLINGSNTVSKA